MKVITNLIGLFGISTDRINTRPEEEGLSVAELIEEIVSISGNYKTVKHNGLYYLETSINGVAIYSSSDTIYSALDTMLVLLENEKARQSKLSQQDKRKNGICDYFNARVEDLNKMLRVAETQNALSSEDIIKDLWVHGRCARVNSVTLAESIAFFCFMGNLGVHSEKRVGLIMGVCGFYHNQDVPLIERLRTASQHDPVFKNKLPPFFDKLIPELKEYKKILAQIQEAV